MSMMIGLFMADFLSAARVTSAATILLSEKSAKILKLREKKNIGNL